MKSVGRAEKLVLPIRDESITFKRNVFIFSSFAFSQFAKSFIGQGGLSCKVKMEVPHVY
jgi:hypothetical protein